MRILRTKLTDWGPHASLDVDMSSGMFGIVGPNGGGKTNFLQAIDFSLTKNLGGRKKETYIRNYGADDGAKKAVVETWWEKGGKQGHIVRTILPSGIKSKLEWDGRTYTKEADIAACMEEIMGVDKSTLVSSIFTKQGRLADLVQGTPGERQDLFFKLLNLTYLNPRAADLAKKIDQLKEGIVDYGPSLVEVQCVIADYRHQIEEVDAEITATPDPKAQLDYLASVGKTMQKTADLQVVIDRHNGSIASYERDLKEACRGAGYDSFADIKAAKLDAEDTLSHNRAALVAMQNQKAMYENYATWECEYNSAMEALNAARAAFPEGASTAAAQEIVYNTLVSELNTARRYETARQEAEQARSAKSAAEVELEEAEKRKESSQTKGSIILMDACRTSIKTNENQLETLREILSFYNLDGTPSLGSTCPTCGQTIPGRPADEIKAKHEECARLTQSVDSTRKRLTELERNMEALVEEPIRTATTRLHVANQLLQAAERKLAGIIPPGSQPPRDSTAVERLVQKAGSDLSLLRKLEAELCSCQVRKKTAEDNLAKFGDKRPTPVDEVRLQQVKDTIRENEETQRKAEEVYNATHRLVIAIDAEKSSVRTAYAELELAAKSLSELLSDCQDASLQACTVSMHELRTRIAQLQEVKGKLEALNTQRASLEQILQDKLAREEELRSLIGKNAKKLELIRELSEARALILKTGTPGLYMNEVFRRMTPMVNATLSDLGANFTVVPDPDLPITYKFIRTDTGTGIELPQETLSGGQAIRLALAMLIAVQVTLIPDVGLLVLDEPSSHIDAEGVASMAAMLARLGKVWENSDIQMIVVDHNPALISSFDKTLDLGDTN